ncbi:MAG: hypothetical protein LBM00_08640 [Deltaproteobacteria bacterium]|nr:hypothetical protein [Deltaproteobacteria bacterium]
MASQGLKYRAAHDPRVAALLVFKEVLQTGADTQAALDRQLKEAVMPPSDKALCTELLYGVLRLHLRLNWFLRQKLPHPEKLPAEMRLLLELAAYEIAYLRIPAHASVNFAAGFLRNRFGERLAGVGNGVLRSFQRNLAAEYENRDFYLTRLAGSTRALSAPSPEFLAVFYSMPEWIVRLWISSYGEEAALRFLEAGLREPPVGVRVNPFRSGCESLLNGLKQTPGAVFIGPAALALPAGVRLAWRTLLDSGRISRQSAAAYEALMAMQPETWEPPVWDACAGRGGKSMALLEQGVAVTLAGDASEVRLDGFRREFKRLFQPAFPDAPTNSISTSKLHPCSFDVSAAEEARFRLASEMPCISPRHPVADSVSQSKEARTLPPCPAVLRAKAQNARAGGAGFGSVLLDVPCSGLGTLARRPEIRWRRSPEDIKQLCAEQDELLEAAEAGLKAGGSIIYLTCTLNPEENQRRVECFVQRHAEFEVVKTWQTPPDSPLNEFFWAARLRSRC